jgi:hypothetical protein
MATRKEANLIYAPFTPRWTPLRYHPKQVAYWNSTARFNFLPCGRRSGKTEWAKRKLVKNLRYTIPGCSRPRYAFGGPTNDQAKEIAWQDLLDLIPDHWIDGGKSGPNVSYSTLKIETRFGSSLRVVGMDKPQRIEGKYLNGFVGDEMSDQKHGFFGTTILPMLADHCGWADLIGIPKRQGSGADWYKEQCDKVLAGDYPDAALFAWPSSDILPPEEVAHARETLDPKDFAEQYDAQWQTAGGGIFHSFDRAYNVRPCRYDSSKPIILGCDFNVDPMAWVLGHRYENRMEWFDEIWLRNTNTQRTLDVLTQRYAGHRGGFEIYGDASSDSRKTSASTTDYQQIVNDSKLKGMGRTLHVPPANPPVEDRFAACNAMFCNAAGDRRMFVDPQCKQLIKDLEGRYYKPGTREVGDKGDLGHITDAMGYPVYRIFPIRTQLTPQVIGMTRG